MIKNFGELGIKMPVYSCKIKPDGTLSRVLKWEVSKIENVLCGVLGISVRRETTKNGTFDIVAEKFTSRVDSDCGWSHDKKGELTNMVFGITKEACFAEALKRES